MTRILTLITGLGTGGAERLVHDIVLRLDPQRFESLVVSLDDASGQVAELLRAAGQRVLGLDRWRRNPWRCARALGRVIDDWQPELVHSHLHHANLTARLAVRSRPRLPVIAHCHVAEQRFRPWHYRQDAATAAFAALELCVSRTVLEHQAARTGLPLHFFRLLYNGIALERFAPASPGREPPSVVAVGQLRSRQKGFDVLLRAWALVLRDVPEASLVIAGEGSERRRLERLAAALPDGGASVRLPGQVEDVPALLASASLACLPSRWEGLPLSAMEAMAAGLPLVASGIGPLRELVEEGEQGLLVPVEDHRALAGALVELLRDPSRREQMGALGRRRAQERFAIERMVAQIEATYEEVLARRDGGLALATGTWASS